MSVFRRASFLGFAIVSLVVLAACGGNGSDGDGSGEAFELPPPGEYSFEVTGTMEIEFLEPGVSAAPLALGGSQIGEFSGGLSIHLGADGSITISDKDSVILRVDEVREGPITFTQNEDKPSTGTISGDGVAIELNVEAELPDTDGTVTTTNEEPIRLESDGDPFSDEGATLKTPSDAEPVRFMPIEGYGELEMAIETMFFRVPTMGQPEEIDEGDEEPEPSTEEETKEYPDPEGDAVVCDTGEAVDNPAVDIRSALVTEMDKGVRVEIGLGQPPTETFQQDFSSATVVGLDSLTGLAQIHDGVEELGILDSSGNIMPGTEDHVTVTPDGVTVDFPAPIMPGDLINVQTFNQKVDGADVACDSLEIMYCGGRCSPRLDYRD